MAAEFAGGGTVNRVQHWMATGASAALILASGQALAQTDQSNTSGTAPKGDTQATTNPDEQAAKRAQQTSQNTQAASVTSVGEVVVTALPHASSLQSLPVAASAYTSERRNLVGITTASDIVNFTPSMSLNGQNLSLRGVNRVITPSFGPPPGVAVFVDGVYTDSPDYLNQPDFFSDRIEILRGPQGTLSGRNAIGGSVNVVSKRPTPDFHEEGRVGYTHRSYFYAQASVSGPITDDLRFRIADAYANQSRSNGFYTNLASSIRPGSGHSNLAEAQLDWKPVPTFDLWARVQNFASDFAPTYSTSREQYPGLTSNYATSFPIEEGTRCPNFQCLAPNVLTELAPNSNPAINNPRLINRNYVGYTRLKGDWTFSTQATWNLPFATIQYIGGFSEYTYQASTDIDGTALTASPWQNQIDFDDETKHWYQNELDIKSADNQRLRWSFGLFQYSQNWSQTYQTREPDQPDIVNPTGGPPNPLHIIYLQNPTNKTHSEAVYGNIDYNITDAFRLTAGIRYTWDHTDATNSLMQVFDTGGIFFATFGSQYVTPPGAPVTAHASWSDWSGKIGAEWRPDSSTLVYGFVAKGYKSGGFVMTNILPIPAVAPETLYDYEVGIKKTFGTKLLVNAGVYYYDYRNLQEILQVRNPISGLIVNDLAGAQKARTYGFELETVWSPTSNFQVTFNYSYLNARFITFTNTLTGGPFLDFTTATPAVCSTFDPVTHAATSPACAPLALANLNGNQLPEAPRNKVTVNPVYTLHLPVGSLSLSATYAWIDKQYYSIFNSPNQLAPSYYNLDLRALYQPPGGHWTVVLYARNVTNQVQQVFTGTGSFTTGPANLVPANGAFATRGTHFYYPLAPRVFGAEVQVRF
jgi:iron complex outermembrane receptor protein